jgi:hypothetical protein
VGSPLEAEIFTVLDRAAMNPEWHYSVACHNRSALRISVCDRLERLPGNQIKFILPLQAGTISPSKPASYVARPTAWVIDSQRFRFVNRRSSVRIPVADTPSVLRTDASLMSSKLKNSTSIATSVRGKTSAGSSP